ncbi:hypothetical protein ABW19_dt0203543 [Dactylella cylindrospora]|nr:hypothetical protein ABW19_dt0203543 [Dactylella cylindrospora]
MTESIFFSGRIEEAIAATVANRKPLVCFVTDDTDDSNAWEEQYLTDEVLSTPLKDAAITVRLLANSTEANYLSAFCAITSYPTLLIIKCGAVGNGGAGVDGLTSITNPISKEDFVTKVQSTLTAAAPTSLLEGVNSSPNFPETPSTSTQAETPAPASSSSSTSTPAASASDSLPANTQFPPESSTARRLASIQEQHRERIARLKSQREAAEIEAAKKRELARRADTKAMNEAADSKKNRSNQQYAEEQKKRKMEAERERKRVLEQIKADREEMRIREANRKAIAAEAEGLVNLDEESARDEKGKGKGKEVVRDGDCNLAFRLLDGSRISNKFWADATIGKDVRPWLDKNRVDGHHPYKLVVQSVGMPSKPLDDTTPLSELGLYPSAILILKPIASSRVSSAYAPASRNGRQQNFIFALLSSIWIMIMTFLGLHNPAASALVGEGEVRGESSSIASGTGAAASVGRDAVRQRIRTLHDGDGDKRSAYYNGNQLDFEPKKEDEDD